MVPITTNQAIAVGYRNGSGCVEGDADVVPGNIKTGVILGYSPDPTKGKEVLPMFNCVIAGLSFSF